MEEPPAWQFTAADVDIMIAGIRRYLYPSASWHPMAWTDDECHEVLDRLYRYYDARRRWELLYLPPVGDIPF